MKNETARREIESLDYYLQNHTNDYSEESHMAMMMAIKALEQQPSEDCISREEAIRIAEQGQIQGYEWQFKRLCTLPSVTPKPRWIPVSEEPKEAGSYITTIKYGDKYAVGQRYYHGKYVGWEDSCVIAYMPLPKPYAESEDKE